jgi:flagellar hook-basal body complex protein FliE
MTGIDAANGVTTNALSGNWGGINGSSALTGSSAAAGTPGATSVSGVDFGDSLSSVVDGLQTQESTTKTLALKAVTGNLDDIHDATIAATRAQVTLELVSAVRNKGVEAFDEIMRMQG